MKYIIYSILLLSTSVGVMAKSGQKSDFIWIKSGEVEPSDFDTYSLRNKNGNTFVVNCSDNPFYRNKHSFIEYENFYGIHVRDFIFKDNLTCHFFKNFLNSVFPAIDERNTIQIKLNRRTGFVEKVLLPELDPLENGDSYNKDHQESELAKI